MNIFDRKITLPDGSIYQGELKEGKPEGKGVLHMPLSGHRYEGTFRDGKFQGQGKYFLSEKDEWIDGQFAAGNLLTGVGRIKCEDGGIYEGGFKNFSRHGKGVFESMHGDRFEGNWEND